jgi:surfactin synthase thioesterase subunit
MTQTVLNQNQLWISCLKPVDKPRLRLIGIPYAGSGPVVYHPWVEAMPPDVEMWGIRLPGRGQRCYGRLSTPRSFSLATAWVL